MARILAASFLGWAAFAFAVQSGIPIWVDWTSWEIPTILSALRAQEQSNAD